VTYRVGTRALVQDVSLSLYGGEVLALVGPNGAGKSTLLRLLAGDLQPSDGDVLLDGRALHRYRPIELARRRAVMPQNTTITFAFAALAVVLMGRHPHLGPGGESPADEAAARGAMACTETLALAARAFPTLSGGEQARVTLARVLAQALPDGRPPRIGASDHLASSGRSTNHGAAADGGAPHRTAPHPPVLLLDEPTAHLDPRHQQAALGLARELAGQGAAVLAIVHDLNQAAAHADRVGLLHGGRLAACGTPWDVLTPGRLTQVFGLPFTVLPHPVLDCPLVVSLPTSTAAPRGREAPTIPLEALPCTLP
jgi:iron complex transport system ATP-binding protein